MTEVTWYWAINGFTTVSAFLHTGHWCSTSIWWKEKSYRCPLRWLNIIRNNFNKTKFHTFFVRIVCFFILFSFFFNTFWKRISHTIWGFVFHPFYKKKSRTIFHSFFILFFRAFLIFFFYTFFILFSIFLNVFFVRFLFDFHI